MPGWRGRWDRVLGGLGLAGLTGKEEAAGWADLRGKPPVQVSPEAVTALPQ
jgi:hypothetical protein